MTEQPDKDLDAEIARYEAMSTEEIEAELREHGIDPQRTVDAVRELVRRKLARDDT
jgi:predicted HTH domain antitoxin